MRLHHIIAIEDRKINFFLVEDELELKEMSGE